MESSSTNAPLAKVSEGIGAAGKTGERETNASNSFKAPQAAEEREINAPCRRKTAENMGTRETNVSEKETAVARRDEKPPTSADKGRPAAGSCDDCRVPGGWRVARPNSGGANHHEGRDNNKPEHW